MLADPGTRAAALAALPAAFVAGIALTEGARRMALKNQVMDVPSERGMSTQVTPRGGGISIVILGTIFGIAAWLFGALSLSEFLGVTGLGLIIAVLGFVDDVKNLPAKVRFPIQGACGVGALLLLHPLPADPLGWAWFALLFVGTVWFINAYNFMDGIDGIAGSQAVAGGLACALLFAPLQPVLSLYSLVLAGAAGGFLVRNWNPAAIFMGDTGSTYLGFTFAALLIAGSDASPGFAPAWAIVFSPFLMDATVTLVMRMANGEKFTEPHRTHVFQLVAKRSGAHGKTVMLGILGWLFVLAPLAALAFTMGSAGWGPALGVCGALAVSAAILRIR
ncbi:MAG: glycosyltransferase family 4 protein, partial [Fimbriimonadaceae bacterium]|nr:glycosyltransferase family 4 protein [Fimbriimonadaceae bacterium]